jgi:Skp family chaperone for outer membrane proteins
VKRKVSLVAGMATLGVAVYLGSRLWAQAPAAPAQAPAQTRIGLVNTLQVIKSYHKFKTFDDELRRLATPFEENDKKLRANLEAWTKESQKPNLQAAEREKAEKEMKDRKRQIEDNALEAKKLLAKRNDEQIVQLYHEIEDAVKRYAVSNGFHIILQYDERTNPAELYSPINIQRKLQGSAGTGCTVPVYVTAGLDITQAVIANLNAGAPSAAPATQPTGAGTQGH